MTTDPTSREAQPTRAWVIHPELTADRARRDAEAALEEGVALAEALPGLEVQGEEIVRLTRPHPGHLFGTGKIEEIKARLTANEIDLVLIDGPVSPVQQRNLEKAWKVKILDRTGLILEIFSDRARTREGVLQVEMAALSYQRTRLVRAWTHRGRPARHRRPACPAAQAARQGGENPRIAPRRPRQGALRGGGAGGLHQRRQIDAVQPHDRGGGDGEGHALRHP